ncbi:MAG: NYN domain-containing protein, partial [Clostridiales bacterium]|nr:NYN domain-containing protein [Clostridiales bacterium]
IGSALKMTGVKEFMEGLQTFMLPPEYPDEFGARIFKISRDSQKNRLTFMKITGGSLRVKEMLGEEKVDQIRLYSGARYELLREAGAGTVCAVTGPAGTFPGQGIGREASWHAPVLAPVLNYRILLPEGCDVHGMLKNLRELEEEDPQLHIVWNEKAGEISVSLMGEVQTEILKRQIWDRFHTAVEFGPGKIVYKETIENTVEGVGHFEPLRHYAEVHLLLEPGEPGSGCQFFTACSEDVLDRNWQRLVLTHLEEREHVGVLTGSALTDVQITLLSGRAHVKHTEGGDFRQATYRAVRQGLRKARSVLLEPCYDFCLEVPPENVGRAMKDIGDMNGEFLPPETEGEMTVLRGSAPVSAMRDYQRQVISYTRGRGQLSLSLKGYVPCREQAQVVEEIGYDPDLDPENPTGSVFCAHGAGFLVPWDQAEDYMHLESELRGSGEEREEEQEPAAARPVRPAPGSYEEEKELQAIFDRTFGPSKRERERAGRGLFEPVHRQEKFQKDFAETAGGGTGSAAGSPGGDGNREAFRRSGAGKPREEYLLVDGYNIIFAWEELKELAGENLRAAQTRLMDILCNYQGYMGCVLILVFDAYRVEGHPEEALTYHNIHVVYTREAETADQYIEKTVHRIGRKNNVTVATSDGLEQIIVMGAGARRLSAQGLYEEICEASRQMRLEVKKRRQSSRTYLFDQATPEVTQYVETVRLGKNGNP